MPIGEKSGKRCSFLRFQNKAKEFSWIIKLLLPDRFTGLPVLYPKCGSEIRSIGAYFYNFHTKSGHWGLSKVGRETTPRHWIFLLQYGSQYPSQNSRIGVRYPACQPTKILFYIGLQHRLRLDLVPGNQFRFSIWFLGESSSQPS